MINTFQIPYPDFKLNEFIDPEQFDLNNKDMVDKINEAITVLNQITDSITDGGSGADKISLTAIAPFASVKLQSFLEEVVNRLRSTTDNVSGADLIGSTLINGLTGATVQAQLESLKTMLDSVQSQINTNVNALATHKSSADHDGRYYTETEIDGKVTTLQNQITTNTNDVSSLKTRATNVESRATSLETRATNVENGKADKTTTYTKTEADALLNAKTNVSGDHKGTWQGFTPNMVGDAILSQRIATMENKVADVEGTPVTLNRGLQTINVTQDTPFNVLNFTGKTVVNLVPLFDSGLWNFGGTDVINTPSKVTITSTGTGSRRATVGAKANQTYTFSGLSSNGYAYIVFRDSSNNVLSITEAISSGIAKTFTSPPNTVSMDFTLEYSVSGTVTFENVMLNEGATALPFVANIKGVMNPTIEAISPTILSLAEADWESGSFDATLNQPIVLNTSNTRIRLKSSIPVSGLSAIVVRGLSTSYALYITELDANNVNIQAKSWFASDFNANNANFVTHANTVKIMVAVKKNDTDVITPSFITTVSPFMGVSKGSVTLMGTFHEGDAVSEVDGQYRVNRKWKEIVFGGSLPCAFNGDESGYKRITVDLTFGAKESNFVGHNLVKYDGKILKMNDTATMEKDSFKFEYWNATKRWMFAIADTDTGWGETYTPTAEEIKAYFLGWRMHHDLDINLPYTSGNKKWSKLYCGIGTKGGTLSGQSPVVAGTETVTLPTVLNDQGYNPYRLLYQLSTPVNEVIPSIGNATLQSGANAIEVTEGRIVREKMNPVKGTFNSVDYYITNDTSMPNGLLKFKTGSVVTVYENGKPFAKHLIETSSAYGNVKITIKGSDYNPRAIYEVDYIPLELYKVSAQTNVISASYLTNLGSVVDSLVNDVSDVEKRVDVVENSMVFKDEPLQWFDPTLLNGWVWFGAYSKVGFAKDSTGNVYLKGTIKSGTINQAIFFLPKGFRPNELKLFSVISNGGASDVPSRLQIASDGQVYVAIGSNSLVSLDGIIFKAVL